ncbi:MAG: hypothetical protein M3441_17115, partial [Chloroflexota bacterium]|nr:hypothetical protein [Chloroflexota bacterium]
TMVGRLSSVVYRPSSPDWAALALYATLAVVFTWPLATIFDNAILGHGNDGWQVVWDLWWMDQAISTGTPPYHFTSVYSPWGTTNYLHLLNPLWGILTLPVQWAFGPIVAYNLSCWLSLILLAFAGYLLGRDVTGSRLAGFVTGFGIAYSPHQMAQYLGHLDVASMQYSVLAVWCLYRGITPSISARVPAIWLLWAGALLAMSALSHPYALIFALLCMLLLGLYRSLASLWQLQHTWWQPVLKTAFATSIGLLVACPFLIAMAQQLQGPDAPRHTGGLAAGDLGEVEFFSADLAAYALPGPFHPLWGEAAGQALDSMGGVQVDRTAALGYALVALALVGIFAPRTRRKAMFWWLLALLGLVLSLGPVLHVAGTDTGVISPASLVWSLPNASFLRVPARFATVVTLGVAVCAGLGLTVLVNWARTTSGRRAIAGLACLVIAAEFLSAPYPTARWNIDPWFDSPDVSNKPGSLLAVPFIAGTTLPLQWQMASGLPLVGGYLSRRPIYPLTDGVPPFTDVGLNRDAFLPPFERDTGTLCKPLPSESTYLDILRLAGVRYVAVDTTYVPEDDPRVVAARRTFPAGPFYRNGPLSIYDTGGGDARPSLFGLVEDTEDWLPLEEGPYRWTAQNYVRFHVWSGAERTARLHLKLASFAQERNVVITAGGKALATGRVGLEGATFDVEWQVPAGFSTVVLTADGQPVAPASLGLGNDYRPLVVKLSECSYSTK